ncbi:ABC transporter substrate-binding protein [Ruania alba]|uniref:ABC-type glycerol-3-phosphate transport system, substrate-binding protein n=1 Tax=Ruania alba TaxID=648782 RepID=A0A1H5H1K8_9MICO|nr:sugar ABC transporter substrate-binding protein [Ruania alba]SEE21624.1 ABC-type glycerol-3-phosphate transport system, substrate-binding protein [Ruania alba]
MNSKKSIGALALLTAGAFALTACQQGSASGGGGDSEDGVVTLQFQSLSDQPATQAAIQEAVDSWNSDNPDVQVEIIQAGWDGAYDKLITQFTGGTAPDIVHFEAASIVAFAQDGYLADLSEGLSEETIADIPEGIWDSVTVNDEIIAYPSTMQSYVAFANADLLEEAGVEVPTGDSMSWDQLAEIAEATTTDDVYGLGWGLGSPAATVMTLAPGFGGDFFSGSGDDVQIEVGDAELEVPERIHEMAYEDESLDPVSLTQSGSDVMASFYGGTVAMTLQGSYQAANMATDAPEDFNWVALPPLEGSEGALQAANPQTYSVNIDSEHVEEATAFLDFFASGETLAAIAQADALIPASESAREVVATETGGEDGWEQILATADGMVGAPFLQANGYAEWKETVLNPALQQYLGDQISSEELATQLTDGWG